MINKAKTPAQLENIVLKELRKYGVEEVDFGLDDGLRFDLETAKINTIQLIKLHSRFDSPITGFGIAKLEGDTAGAIFRYDDKIKECFLALDRKAVANEHQVIREIAGEIKSEHLAIIDKKNYLLQTITHEFGHSFSNYFKHYDLDKYYWNEIKKVKKKYDKAHAEFTDNYWKKKIISEKDYIKERDKYFISDYANTNINEFVAESFAMSELSENPSPYAKEVHDIIVKYFGKR